MRVTWSSVLKLHIINDIKLSDLLVKSSKNAASMRCEAAVICIALRYNELHTNGHTLPVKLPDRNGRRKRVWLIMKERLNE